MSYFQPDNLTSGFAFCLSAGVTAFICVYTLKKSSLGFSWSSSSSSNIVVESPQVDNLTEIALVPSPNAWGFLCSSSDYFTAEPSFIMSAAVKGVAVLGIYKLAFFVCSGCISAVTEGVILTSLVDHNVFLSTIHSLAGLSLEVITGFPRALFSAVSFSTKRTRPPLPPPPPPVIRPVQGEGGDYSSIQLGAGSTPNPFGEGIPFVNYPMGMLGLDPDREEEEQAVLEFFV